MSLYKLFFREIDRRDFIMIPGKLALGTAAAKAALAGGALLALESILSGCATTPPTAGQNPYFKGPGHEKWTFMRSIYDGWTPGIGWVVSPNTPMVAVAPGEVIYAQPIRIPGHAGGLDLWVHHYGDVRGKALRDGSVIPGPPYESHYAHLNRLEKGIGVGKQVSRGQVLGYAGDYDTYQVAKLMLMEEGNLVNPDNYGPGHSFMNYWDGSLNLEINDIDDRIRKQSSLLHKLFETYLVNDKWKLFKKLHRKGYYGYCWWSLFEQFRYLEKKYAKKPEQFNLPKAKFETIKKEFYANQPIILTLPFKNPRKK